MALAPGVRLGPYEKAHSGMTEYQVLQHFPSWREAVAKAGLALRLYQNAC